MRRLIPIIALSLGCGAVPDADAVNACRQVFDAWSEAATACGLEATMPDRDAVCSEAYSYNQTELDGCLQWIRSDPCQEMDNTQFKAHCGKALYLKTW